MNKDVISSLLPANAKPAFLDEFLENYLSRGFGSQSKRELDVLVIHLLCKYGGLEKSTNNELSHLLQITEARVRGLLYEAKLKYPPEEDKYIEKQILLALAKSQFDVDKQSIRFIVENSYVRFALQAKVKSLGGVPDSSFNREVVNINWEQLAVLIEDLYGKDVAERFKKEFKQLVEKGSKVTFKEVRKKVLLGAAGALGGAFVKILKAALTGDPT